MSETTIPLLMFECAYRFNTDRKRVEKLWHKNHEELLNWADKIPYFGLHSLSANQIFRCRSYGDYELLSFHSKGNPEEFITELYYLAAYGTYLAHHESRGGCLVFNLDEDGMSVLTDAGENIRPAYILAKTLGKSPVDQQFAQLGESHHLVRAKHAFTSQEFQKRKQGFVFADEAGSYIRLAEESTGDIETLANRYIAQRSLDVILSRLLL